MDKKIKVIQLKILLVILEIFLVLLIWTLLQLIFKQKDEAEHFQAQPEAEIQETFNEQKEEKTKQPKTTPIPTPEPTPFVFTNFDKIRVVITNKETGGIYHESIEEWQERTDYRGTFEFVEEKEGFVIINELLVEEYLYSVVPSEMPADYSMEALKAQAICARTYAYLHILSPGYPKYNAHVNDTTAYQVYHMEKEDPRTNQAVNETCGKILLEPSGSAPAQTYYYSTSCGYGSDAHVWRTKYADNYPYIKSQPITSDATVPQSLTEEEFVAFIKDVRDTDYEAKEGWYRWTYEVEELDAEYIYGVLQKRYKANSKLILTKSGNGYVRQPIKKFNKILDIQILKRGPGGVADELLLITDKKTYKIITELNIRYVLNDGCSQVNRQDGEKIHMNQLLPSGFIALELTKDKDEVVGYTIYGGGYGHGAGMSQNAARTMAEKGMTAEEILAFFYKDCFVKEKEETKEKRMSKGIRITQQFTRNLKKMNLATYASSGAFYIFLSLVPMLVVICTIIPYTPITQGSLQEFVLEIFPAKVENILIDIIEDVYERSAGVLSAAILVTLWSAGKGILAVRRGLNAVNEVEEYRNYFLMRLISSFYTLVFLAIILISMIILVFGNVLVEMILGQVPKLQPLFSALLSFRFLFIWGMLTLIFAAFYAYLPDKKLKFFSQLTGASLSAAIWSVFSWGFSIYVSLGKPYNIYGSLSIIVLTMVWLYICIYIILVGAYINKFLEDWERE